MKKSLSEVFKDIKNGETWVGKNFKIKKHKEYIGIYINNKKPIIDRRNLGEVIGINFYNDELFERERKTYQFSVAFVEYENGKTIESVESGVKFSKNRNHFGFFPSEIKGRWYINE